MIFKYMVLASIKYNNSMKLFSRVGLAEQTIDTSVFAPIF